MKNDIIIIGAGIVGLATAYKILEKNPNIKITIIEKEERIGKHQSGNNSGVIHSGIYYAPGSLKARNCLNGYKLLLNFCDQNDIDYELCGKILLAVNEEQIVTLNEIYERGIVNGLDGLQIRNKDQIRETEPLCEGLKAIYIPQTGIIDYKVVMQKIKELIEFKGGNIILNSCVVDIKLSDSKLEIITDDENYQSKYAVCCTGLNSDRIASLTNPDLDFRIIPFRGEYYNINPQKKILLNSLIYPVPDPSFPFLGVHFTKKMNGEIEAGPNAVLAFKREGYSKFSFNLKDTLDTLKWPGFHKLAYKYWRKGLGEFYRSFSKSAFVGELRKLVPVITDNDLTAGGTGVRAQACSISGNLVDDFKLIESERILHVCNAPSPAATASLAIGESIADIALRNVS